MKLRVPFFNLICFFGLVAIMTMPLQAQAKKGAAKKAATAKSSKSVQLSATELAAMEERKAMAKPSGHYKVDVYIKKSGVVSGLAMNGEFVEKRGHKGYQKAKKETVGSGIRLWYYSDLPGFLFIQYASIEKIVVGRQMTIGEMKTMTKLEERPENQVGMGAGAKRMAMADLPDFEEMGKVVVLKKNGRMKGGFGGLNEAQVTLMKAYSPEKGYSPKRYAAMQKALVLKNKKLSPVEDQWAAVYPDWLVAYKIYTGQCAADPDAKATTKTKSKTKAAKTCKTAVKTKKKAAKPAVKVKQDKNGRVAIKRQAARPALKRKAGQSAPVTPSGGDMKRGR